MNSLSIVIPCLNEEHYIGKLLQSLYKQTYKSYEIIIVDGKSKDKTREVTRDFIPKFKEIGVVLRLVEPDKRGVSFQRNCGASYSSFERLLFLDADVQVRPHFLEHTVSQLEERELSLATCDFEPMSSRFDDKLLYSIACVYFRMLQFTSPITMGWCIYSTKKVHTLIHGFDERMTFGEDADYVQRAAEKGFKMRVLHTEKVYVSVRRLNDEGRLNYYKKIVFAEMYRIVNGKLDKELFDYEFGKFKEDVESMKVDSTKESQWRKLLHALQLNGDDRDKDTPRD